MNISAEHKNRESLAARQLSELKASVATDSKPAGNKGLNSVPEGKTDSDPKPSKSKAFGESSIIADKKLILLGFLEPGVSGEPQI